MTAGTCITVIDESQNSNTAASIRADWLNFRANYPNRIFWLLQPGTGPASDLFVPTEYYNDPKANGPINVARDEGIVANRSDWFVICGLGSLPTGAVVSLAIDTSGSMTFNTIQASYDLFVEKCAQAGLVIILDDRFPNERWAPPHNKALPAEGSFSASPQAIKGGQSSTLSWSATGEIDSVNISPDVGAVLFSGTTTVSPTSTTTYTLSIVGPGGTTSVQTTVTVYVPPETSLSVDNSSIVRGQCTTLRWVTTGDATSATITPGIGSVNINGLRQVCPTETTTYEIYVDGLGGTASDSITLIVYQPPTVELTGPVDLNYNQQGVLRYEATNVDVSLAITPTYNYRGSTVTGTVVNLSLGASVTGDVTTQIPYNNTGPFSVTYTIVATGNGGQETEQITIPINIDETPENFLIPESVDLLKNQEPIYTPDNTATSYKIVIDDIDIPVEIKADKPILVDINEQDSWDQIRRI